MGEEQPQIFNRENRELNYFEVRLHKDFLDKLGSEKFEVDLGTRFTTSKKITLAKLLRRAIMPFQAELLL